MSGAGFPCFTIDQARHLQTGAHSGFGAARGHSHGETAEQRSRELGHRTDGLQLRDASGENFHLQLVNADGIDACAVTCVKLSHHILLLHAGAAVEIVLGELKRRVMLLQRLHPREVMQRHRIDERAVAVKDEALERVVGYLQGHERAW